MVCIASVIGCKQTDPTTSSAPEAVLKDAATAYVYLYPLVVFGVSDEALTNVEKPMWEPLSAPLNQFMSVCESRPANHGVILPSLTSALVGANCFVCKELPFRSVTMSRLHAKS